MNWLKRKALNFADDRNWLPHETPDRWKWIDTQDVLAPEWEYAVTPEGVVSPDSPIANSIQEPIPFVFTFPLLSVEYCEWLIDHADKLNRWSVDKGDDYAALEVNLTRLGWALWNYHEQKIVGQALRGIMRGMFGWDLDVLNRAFMIRYVPEFIPSMDMHHDETSQISLSINLNDPGCEYDGGEMVFCRQPNIGVAVPAGHAIMFGGGNPMHQHKVMPTTWGTRYSLVYWIQ